MRQILFIGESRSNRAKEMGVHWADGRLAAKTLFDALRATGIDPTQHKYINLFEKRAASVREILAHKGPRVGMGRKVCTALAAAKIAHAPLTHPAARGAIRRKEVYAQHVADVVMPLLIGAA